MDDFMSLAEIEAMTGEPRNVLNYALARYGPPPTRRIGMVRVWSRDRLPAIHEALRKTARNSRLERRQQSTTAATK